MKKYFVCLASFLLVIVFLPAMASADTVGTISWANVRNVVLKNYGTDGLQLNLDLEVGGASPDINYPVGPSLLNVGLSGTQSSKNSGAVWENGAALLRGSYSLDVVGTEGNISSGYLYSGSVCSTVTRGSATQCYGSAPRGIIHLRKILTDVPDGNYKFVISPNGFSGVSTGSNYVTVTTPKHNPAVVVKVSTTTLDFGNVAMSESVPAVKNISIKNTSSIPTHVDVISSNTSYFAVDKNKNVLVPANSSVTLKISFYPKTPESARATINVVEVATKFSFGTFGVVGNGLLPVITSVSGNVNGLTVSANYLLDSVYSLRVGSASESKIFSITAKNGKMIVAPKGGISVGSHYFRIETSKGNSNKFNAVISTTTRTTQTSEATPSTQSAGVYGAIMSILKKIF